MWTQDESRCGLLPILRRRITARGIQPLVPSASPFESLYLYGAVEPLTGQSFFLELPTLNTQGFQLFLDHFAALDRTSFHPNAERVVPPATLPTHHQNWLILPEEKSNSGLTW